MKTIKKITTILVIVSLASIGLTVMEINETSKETQKTTVEFEFDEEDYINDIPFNTAEIVKIKG